MVGDKIDCTTCRHFEDAKHGEALVCAGCPEYDPENTEEVVCLSKWEPKEQLLPIGVVEMDASAITASPMEAEKYLERFVWKPRA